MVPLQAIHGTEELPAPAASLTVRFPEAPGHVLALPGANTAIVATGPRVVTAQGVALEDRRSIRTWRHEPEDFNWAVPTTGLVRTSWTWSCGSRIDMSVPCVAASPGLSRRSRWRSCPSRDGAQRRIPL